MGREATMSHRQAAKVVADLVALTGRLGGELQRRVEEGAWSRIKRYFSDRKLLRAAREKQAADATAVEKDS